MMGKLAMNNTVSHMATLNLVSSMRPFHAHALCAYRNATAYRCAVT
jgi:hypothetical protein